MAESWGVNLVAEIVADGDDVRVTLVGDIDAASATAVEHRLSEVIESAAGAMVVNMSGISFIDSTGLRAVVAIHRRLSEKGRSLVLRDLSAPTRRLFDLTGLGPALGVDDAM
jgi:anti-anti-sigma factor